MTLATVSSMVISLENFNPPLKRTEAAVPGYWTIDELAAELEVSRRYVHYLIKGNPKTGIPIRLKAYNAGNTLLVADQDALQYLWNIRLVKKKNS